MACTATADHRQLSSRAVPDTQAGMSVEFRIDTMGAIYLSRLWQMPEEGMCFLIKDNSAVLKHIRVGTKLDVRMISTDPGTPDARVETEVSRIFHRDSGRFKGHHLIALALEKPVDSESSTD